MFENILEDAIKNMTKWGCGAPFVDLLQAANDNELVLAVNIDEVKEIRDKAEALRMYAKQAGESLEMQNQCAEIKIRAARRAGEIFKEFPKKPGKRLDTTSSSLEKVKTHGQVLKEVKLPASTANRWEASADIPEEDFEAHIVNHIPPIVVENEKTQDVEISLDKGIIIKYILNSQKDRCRYTIA